MSAMDRKTIINMVIWTLTLALFWLFLSGFLKPLLLGFGVVSVALVMLILHRMNRIDAQPQQLPASISNVRYTFWLLGQIVLSSLEVAKLVWGNSKNLSPAIAKLPVKDIPNKSRVLYANSITLTPGTLSVDIDEQHVTVHALNERSIKSLQTGEMARKVAGTAGAKS